MATKKPVKKTTKAAVKKKPVSRARAKTTKQSSSSELKSFKIYRDTNFLEFKISRQTVYWTILVSFIILMQLWILKVQFEVMQATDSINALIGA